MFIQTEATPNPATLKFLPGRDVSPAETCDFASAEEAARSPLAQALFAVDGVGRVMLGSDFVAVTLTKGEWQHAKPSVLGAIMEHFLSGAPVLSGDADGIIVHHGFPAPPSYHSAALLNAPASTFYNAITNGYGVMYSDAARISPRDRWAIVAYIRALQLSRHAKLADAPDAAEHLR